MTKGKNFDTCLNVLTADIWISTVASVGYLRKGHSILSDFTYFMSSRKIHGHFLENLYFWKLPSVQDFELKNIWSKP